MLGEFALDNIEYIESSESRALVEHRVPGLSGSYFQDMGTVPNTIVIAGTKHGDEERVVAYDWRTGELVWSHADRARYETTIGGIGPRATPAPWPNRSRSAARWT